jgi:hypothetical protein
LLKRITAIHIIIIISRRYHDNDNEEEDREERNFVYIQCRHIFIIAVNAIIFLILSLTFFAFKTLLYRRSPFYVDRCVVNC